MIGRPSFTDTAGRGTDGDLTIRTRIDATVESDGVFIVPHALLAAQMKAKGTTTFRDLGEEVQFESGFTGQMRTLPIDEYPQCSELFTGTGIEMDLAALSSVAVQEPSAAHAGADLVKGPTIAQEIEGRLFYLADPAVRWVRRAPTVEGCSCLTHDGPSTETVWSGPAYKFLTGFVSDYAAYAARRINDGARRQSTPGLGGWLVEFNLTVASREALLWMLEEALDEALEQGI